MIEEIEYKLNQIADIWNHFIWEYNFCKKNIRFDLEAKTNYFGDILGYFQDTNDIIFNYTNPNNQSERFSKQISLLQSIYVQQDFIEELLRLFKLKLNKGNLKKDPNYYINRDLRNELVGHPIRRENGNGKLISSCLFGYNGDSDKITYLKYHKDKDYEFESVEFLVNEIINRHKNFLNFYFDKILLKLKGILKKYIAEIKNLESLIEKKGFTELLQIVSVYYESIFKSDYIYDKESLSIIYSKKNDHIRYQYVIDKFYKDLKSGLKEIKEYISELFEPRKIYDASDCEKQIINIQLVTESDFNSNKPQRPISYNYELGKLATRRNQTDFEFFGGCLKRMCADNKLVLEELNHMEKNIWDEIEYYSSYKLICKELREE